MPDRAPTGHHVPGLCRVLRLVADETRLELLRLIGRRERAVTELARAAGLDVSAASHHLRAMAREGLLARRRLGNRVLYSRAAHPWGLAVDWILARAFHR